MVIAKLLSSGVDRSSQARTITATNPHGVAAIAELATALAAAGIGLDDLSLRQPTLDDVFLTLTGSAPVGADPTDPGGSDL